MPTYTPATDEKYKEAVGKGETRLALMSTTHKKGSIFDDFPTLFNTWCYRLEPLSCSTGNEGYGITKALQGVGISAANEDWKATEVRHGDLPSNLNEPIQTYDVKDKGTFRFTRANYTLAINHKDGVWLCPTAYGPASETKNRQPPFEVEEFPELQRFSDILWGLWVCHHNESKTKVDNLNYIVDYLLTSRDSQSIVLRALSEYTNNPNAKFESWEKKTRIPADSKQGKAILGKLSLHA